MGEKSKILQGIGTMNLCETNKGAALYWVERFGYGKDCRKCEHYNDTCCCETADKIIKRLEEHKGFLYNIRERKKVYRITAEECDRFELCTYPYSNELYLKGNDL